LAGVEVGVAVGATVAVAVAVAVEVAVAVAVGVGLGRGFDELLLLELHAPRTKPRVMIINRPPGRIQRDGTSLKVPLWLLIQCFTIVDDHSAASHLIGIVPVVVV
jgi:hypothetical protein